MMYLSKQFYDLRQGLDDTAVQLIFYLEKGAQEFN